MAMGLMFVQKQQYGMPDHDREGDPDHERYRPILVPESQVEDVERLLAFEDLDAADENS